MVCCKNVGLNSVLCAIITALMFVQPSSHAFAQKSWTELPSKPIEIGETFKIESEVLGDKREINVWTPPSYRSGDRTYPTLYIIDGGLDQDFHHVSGLAQLATVNGSFEEIIVVGVRTNNRYEELIHEMKDPEFKQLEQFKDRVGKSATFLEHIKEEVIPLIEARYRVNERRAVVGESLAGLFIAEVFLTSPETFSDYICVSPSLWWDYMRMTKKATDLLAKHDKSPRRIYVTIANEGGMMREAVLKFVDAIKVKSDQNPKQLESYFVDREASHEHSTIYHPAVHDALLKLFPVEKK